MSTKHFLDQELRCKCGCGKLPPQELQERLEELREAFGAPMVISSGARCENQNDAVSSTGRSGPHTVGAFDILIDGTPAYQLLALAIALQWKGIGIHQKGPRNKRFIHIDDRRAHPGPAVWSY